jgi:UDP-arabinose 4-epimerase
MRVLVTGGAGYVGSHACKAFARAGWDVFTFDNLSRGWREAVKWGPLIQGDLNDPPALDAAMEQAQPDLVVHFAALAYVGESMAEPAIYYRNNVAGSLCLLDAMGRAGVGRLIFSSSCATYGIPPSLPISEETEQRPINPYGATKLMVERMIADHAAAYGLSAVSLRYFNAAGLDPDGELFERHEPETHVIPLAIAAARGGTPFTVNGRDFATPDGTAVRDFIHVSDLAEAHVLAADYCARLPVAIALNLGTGQGTSVAQIVAAVEAETGRKIDVHEGPRRPGDPAELVASAERARTAFGWTPRYSDIATIVRTACASPA